MSYSQSTSKYRIPVLGYGDTIEPSVELEKWQMVENFFMSCMRGETTAVFKEGDLELENGANGVVNVVMYAGGNGVICCGVSGGRYFEAKKPVMWNGLKPGRFYYLYVASTSRTFEDYSEFEVSSSEISLGAEGQALIATVDLRGDDFVVDRFPEGKNTPGMLASHIDDNVDPHGEILHQTNLSVENRLDARNASIGRLAVSSLVVGGVDVRFDGSKLVNEVVECEFAPGESRICVSRKGKVVYAQCLDGRISFGLSKDGIAGRNTSSDKIKTVLMLTVDQMAV